MHSPTDSAEKPEDYSLKKIEIELEESRQLLKKIEKIGGIGHWEVDLDTGKNKWSSQFYHILGLDPDTIPETELFFSSIHPEDRERALFSFRKSLSNGSSYHIENRIIRPSGEMRCVVSDGEVKLSSENKLISFFGTLRDVTEDREKKSVPQKNNLEIDNILQSSQDLIIITDEKGIFTNVSVSCKKILGYSSEEMIGKSFESFIQTSDSEGNIPTNKFDINLTSAFTNRFLRADNSIIHLNWSTTFDPKTNTFFAIGRDLTHLFQTKEELKADRKKLSLLLNTSRDLIWAIDRKYCLITANQPFLDRLETNSNWNAEYGESLLSEKYLQPEYIAQWQSFYDRAFNGENVIFVLEDNLESQINHLEFEIKPVFEGAKIQTLACYAKDISRRKKEELIINDLVEKLKMAQKIGKIGYWEYDAATNKIFWSEENYRIWKMDTSFIPDFEFFIKSIHPDDREICLQENIIAIRDKTPLDYTHRIVLENGEIKYLHEKGTPLLHEDGTLAKYQGTVQDITEEQNSKKALLNKTELIETTALIIQSFLELSDWESLIDGSLKLMGETVNADRTYFFKNYSDPESGRLFSQLIREWNNGNFPSEIDNPLYQSVPLDENFNFLKSVYQKEPFEIFASDCKKDERGTLKSQKIKSTLQIPLFVEHKFYGYIGFDDCSTGRIWNEDEKNFLKSITTNLSFAIERKQSMDKIQEALESRNSILESIGDGFYAVDNDMTVTYWNKVAEEKTGIKREQIIGKNLNDFLKLNSNQDYSKQFSKAFSEQIPIQFETFDVWLKLWNDVTIYPSQDGLSVFVRDITEKKLAEDQLKEFNERLEIISSATNDAIWDWTIATGEHYWGDGFQKTFGLDPEIEGISQNYWEKRVHPDDFERVKLNLDNILKIENFTVFEIEYRFLKGDGTYAHISDKGSIIRDKKGTPIRLVGAMQDISHRKVYEESLKKLNEDLANSNRELEISNKELEQFAYVASHDLQEPLRMISSFLGLIEKKYNAILDEKGRQYIHHAVDGARRMRQIILDLLEFSRIGNTSESKKWVSSKGLIEEVLLLNQKNIKDRKAIIHLGDLPQIFCHSSAVVQLFQNLISNAIKYQKEDVIPEVWINGSDEGKFWEFSVKDNGIGIEEDYLTKIFIIFQRLHQKEQYEGSGIGLAICKKIVEIHGGKIWAKSTFGTGSIFCFTIKK